MHLYFEYLQIVTAHVDRRFDLLTEVEANDYTIPKSIPIN